MWAFFASRFPYGHAQLSERGNAPSLMTILYFVEQKRFVGQGRLESPSLLCRFYESVKRRTNTKKIEKKKQKKKHNNNNKLDNK